MGHQWLHGHGGVWHTVTVLLLLGMFLTYDAVLPVLRPKAAGSRSEC